MVLMASSMLPLGTRAQDFTLWNPVRNALLTLSAIKPSPAIVIMFICNHCPYVQHIQQQLLALAWDYQPQGVEFIAINSNDIAQYPEDAPEEMVKVAQKYAYPFPYLFDETQAVAKAYQAACTPDFYLFGKNLLCAYRGQLDDARPGNQIPVTGKDLRIAIDNVLAGKPVELKQKPSTGCSIKWKKSE